MQLSDEQKKYVENNTIEDTVLIACPGSGKTTCILHRIYYLIDNLKVPPHKILFLSFNKHTVEDARIRMRNMPKFNKFAQIRTIDSLCYMVVKEINIDFVKDVSLLAIKVLKTSDNDFAAAIPDTQIPRVIFVDEAQDLNSLHWAFINKYVACLRNKKDPYVFGEDVPMSLNLVGDMNQSIYQFRGSSSNYLTTFAAKQFILSTNYRSNAQIVALANAIMPNGSQYVMKSASSSENVKPTFFFPNDPRKFFDSIAKFFKAKGERETMCIASPWRGKDDMRGLAYLTNMLHLANIPFKIYYDESKDTDGDTKSRIKFEPICDKLMVFSYHFLKGLEFDHTIICDTYHSLVGSIMTEQEQADSKYLLFVALTRARKTLWICNFHPKYALHGTILRAIVRNGGVVNVVGKYYPRDPQRNRKEYPPTSVTELLDKLSCSPESLQKLEALIAYKTEKCAQIPWPNNPIGVHENNTFNGKYLELLIANEYCGSCQRLNHLGDTLLEHSNPKDVKLFNTMLKWMPPWQFSRYIAKYGKRVKKILATVGKNDYRRVSLYYKSSHNALNCQKVNEIATKYHGKSPTVADVFNAILADHAIETMHYWIIDNPGSRDAIMRENWFSPIGAMAKYMHESLAKLAYQREGLLMVNNEIALNFRTDFENDGELVEIKTYNLDTVPFVCALQMLLYAKFNTKRKFNMINLRNGSVHSIIFDNICQEKMKEILAIIGNN